MADINVDTKVDIQTNAAKPLFTEAAKLLSDLCGPGFKQMGEAFGETVAVWRVKRLVGLRRRIAEISGELPAGEIRRLPPGLAIQILDAASLEDQEEIVELWACLIANSIDPEKDVSANKAFVRILRDLDPLDARILEFLKTRGRLEFANLPNGGYNAERIAKELAEENTIVARSLGNLFGLGCIATDSKAPIPGTGLISGGVTLNPDIYYRLSNLGLALVNACKR